MSSAPTTTSAARLAGCQVGFAGKLAGMPRRSAAALVKQHGGAVVELDDPALDLVVVGDEDLPGTAQAADDWFPAPLAAAVEAGRVAVLCETQLWQRLGLVEAEPNVRRLYTPAMLAELLGVSVAVIRRWHRRGLIVPVREVQRLPYFDFQEIASARRLAELLAAGVSPAAIEKKLAALRRYLPNVERPLAQLSVIVEGRHFLLRQGDGLLEPGGQFRFEFADAGAAGARPPGGGPADVVALPVRPAQPPADPETLAALAAQCEDDRRWEQAAELYRAALAAGGPSAELCFKLAEVLCQLGDVAAARERYFMAIELDENFVEARANLGCVLADTGQRELAVAAFSGALEFHPDYADAHYHLARTLDELGQTAQADRHWRAFLDLTPDSPWAQQARQRLGLPADAE